MLTASLRARVREGRLVLDEPTDLPEGTEVELIPAEDIDTLEPAERARLFGFLQQSIREHTPGTGIPAADILERVHTAR
jgi:hypothetical protein